MVNFQHVQKLNYVQVLTMKPLCELQECLYSAKILNKPGQAKVLTDGEDLRKAQVDVQLSVSHSCI